MTTEQRYFRLNEDPQTVVVDFSYDDEPAEGDPFLLVVPAGETLRVLRETEPGWIDLQVPGIDEGSSVPSNDPAVGEFVDTWPGEPKVTLMDFPTAQATYPENW